MKKAIIPQYLRKTIVYISVFALCFSLICSSIPIAYALEPGYGQYYDKNVVQDWGFEDGGAAWDQRKGGIVSDGESALNGSAKLSGCVPEGTAGYIGQIVTLPEGHEPWYNLHFMAKMTPGTTAFVQVRANDANGPILRRAQVTSTKWFRPEETGLIDVAGKTKLFVQLEKTSTTGSAYIDCVCLSPRTANPVKDPPEGKPVEPNLPPDSEFTEIWRDDFDGNTLNSDDWGYELGCIRGVEQQHYVDSDKNVFLRDGNLVIKATKRAPEAQYTNPRGTSQVIYDSGSVRTAGKREFLYGKLEIRARLPKGQGVFPAFWTLGADFSLDGTIADNQGYGWPRCGEIDIVELMGGDVTKPNENNKNYVVYGTAHCYGKWDAGTDHKLGGVTYRQNSPNEPFNANFHTFGINWSPNKITWYVDGKDYYTVDITDDELAKRAFNRPHFAQLNLAMGYRGGEVGTNLDGTEFQIDYISYSQTETQKKAAEEYYKTAPTIEGVKDLTVDVGTTPDLLSHITASDGYYVDFSIDDSPMFKNNPAAGESGNTAVHRVCSGKHEIAKVAELPAGTYRINYTAMPNGMVTDESRQPDREQNYQFARKSATLVIKNPVHEHEGVLVEGKEATCTETGLKPYYTCSCGQNFEDKDCTKPIENLDEWRVIPVKSHTADDHGWYYDDETHYHKCSVCGTIMDQANHTYGEWQVTKAATEDETGLKVRSCVCGHTEEEIIPKLAHTHKPTLVEGKEATCTETGLKPYYTCKCGQNFEDENCTKPIENLDEWRVIPVKPHTADDHGWYYDDETHYHKCGVCGTIMDQANHTYGEWQVTKEATEDETGLKEHSCVCGHTEEQVIPKLSHTHKPTLVEGKEATCTETGLKPYYTCKCGQNFEDEACTKPITDLDAWREIPVKPHTADDHGWYYDDETHYHKCGVCETIMDQANHTYGEWQVTKEATEEETGLKVRSCICGHTEEEIIPKLPHTHKPTLVPGKEATANSTGLKAYYTCSCGQNFEDESCTKPITNLDEWRVIPAKTSEGEGTETPDEGELNPSTGDAPVAGIITAIIGVAAFVVLITATHRKKEKESNNR